MADLGTKTFALAARDARLVFGVVMLRGVRVAEADEGVKAGAEGVNVIDEAVRLDDGVEGRDEVGVARALRLPCIRK